jgi:hypothetical protein
MLSKARRSLIHALSNSVGVLVANSTALRLYVRDEAGLVVVLEMERAGRQSVNTFKALHRGFAKLTPRVINRVASQVTRMTSDLGTLRTLVTEREAFNILDDLDQAAGRARAQLEALRDLA